MNEFMKTIINGLKTWTSSRIKNSRGNWNQNDPTADDYIKGRTHWVEKEFSVILPETTLTTQEAELTTPFVVGQVYNVTWNGVTYNCIAKEYDGYVMIGNNAIYEYDGDIETDTGEPFAIECEAGDAYAYIYLPVQERETEATTETYTVKITAYVESVHKLDKKYLPDMSGFMEKGKDDKINVVWSGFNASGAISSMTYTEILEALGSRPVSDLNIILSSNSSTDAYTIYPFNVEVCFGNNDFAIYADIFGYTISDLTIYRLKLAMDNGNRVIISNKKAISLANLT